MRGSFRSLRHRWRRVVGVVLGFALAAAGPARPARAADLTVFAAASLTNALTEVAAEYQKTTGTHAAFNFAASSTLALQIQEGAPADVFFSADDEKMNALEKKGLLVPGTRRRLLSNTLVIVVYRESPLAVTQPLDLARLEFGHIAIAEPQTVPAGIYAKQYLKAKGVWSRVIDKLIPTENVRAALAAVESGNVEAGIVYKTDAAISKNVRIAYDVPQAETPAISYPVAVVKTSREVEAASRFVEYLASEPALAVFRKYGFLVPVPPR